MNDFQGLRIALVGPLPPPAGGMANQTAQLATLLRQAGARVELVQSNPPWRPRWLAGVRGLRAVWRLPFYLWRLWRAAGRAQLLHVMANSGWSWHLHAAPAIWTGWLRGKAVLVNYRGGEAAAFMDKHGRLVRWTMRRAQAVVVPSDFLAQVFERHDIATAIVANIIDLARFQPRTGAPAASSTDAPVILVARHLEPLYDNASALRAFAILRNTLPAASMVVCGAGTELPALRQLAGQLTLGDRVHFAGHLDNAAMAAYYRRSDLMLNPSLADNMPISVLEALASGVPVVSTNVGGIPFLLQQGVTGLLVPPGDAAAMASAMLALLQDPPAAARMAQAGIALARSHSWPEVAPRLLAQYRRALLGRDRRALQGRYRHALLERYRRALPAEGWPQPGAATGRSLYTALVAALLFPLHEKLKSHASVAMRRRLERSQWWPAARIEALQLQRLRDLLLRAQAEVPYYQALFAQLGFDPQRMRSLAALRRLPLLHKADINAYRDDFAAAGAPPLQRFNTGGSSGEPLIFFLGKERISHDVAAKWRATRWWGVDIGDREAVLWGSPIELGRQDRWRAWRDRLLRTRLLPAFDLSPATLDDYLRRLRKQRPAMLFGYPSALARLAAHAQARQVALDELGVRVVFVTAEKLYDEQRALITQVFGCPVANGYGGRDAGFLAHECPEGGMHLSAEDIIVEIIDARGQPVPLGDSGNIVVTHLASGDFPFIRYATGDVGALDAQPCRCGRGLPLLKHIDGRATDFVVARDGTVMHGLALIYILRDLPQVRAFKIIQESLDLTCVLIVVASQQTSPATTATLPAEVRAAIVGQFQRRLGASVDIDIREVDAIAAEASGKYRYVVSKVVLPS